MDVRMSLHTLFSELVDGPSSSAAWILNPGDAGLLKSLDAIDAAGASRSSPTGGASVAAHVDHLRYGLSLLNRWNRGENPFGSADYAASWARSEVNDDEWRARRLEVAREVREWRMALLHPRAADGDGIVPLMASVAHVAYHLGALRQMNSALRGPPAAD